MASKSNTRSAVQRQADDLADFFECLVIDLRAGEYCDYETGTITPAFTADLETELKAKILDSVRHASLLTTDAAFWRLRQLLITHGCKLDYRRELWDVVPEWLTSLGAPAKLRRGL